jgi:hypothetical protein
MAENGSAIKVAIEYLRTLDEAGLPPPPTPAIIRMLLTASYEADTNKVYFKKDWCAINRDVLAITLHHASSVHVSTGLHNFLTDLRCVTLWAKETTPSLDSNQRHAGWQWLLRQTRHWSKACGLQIGVEGLEWSSYLPLLRMGKYGIVPLLSERELIAEGIAMRNCIATYTDDCAANRARLFSVRMQDSGKRVADIGIYEEEDDVWDVFEVAGKANSSVNKELEQLAQYLARLYSLAVSTKNQHHQNQSDDVRDRNAERKAAEK